VEREFWLLSDVPTDTDAAVNVDGSVRLARYCGIPDALFVSDCCCSPADDYPIRLREVGSVA
jgi:hypothetical protein